jgi:hypothetical protein
MRLRIHFDYLMSRSLTDLINLRLNVAKPGHGAFVDVIPDRIIFFQHDFIYDEHSIATGAMP